MVSEVIGETADQVFGAVDDAVGEDLAKADAFLSGKERSPTDIEKVEAKFARGLDLSTPDGDVPATAAAPNDPSAGGPAKSSVLSTGKRIEFIHFGRVHRDWARNFHHDRLMSDLAAIDLGGVVGSRAIAFRAALEREAVLLAGFARATQAALAEKDEKEGATGDLLTAAADLLGGATGTAQTAVAADLTPFVAKIEQEAWAPLNQLAIRYADLHTAGIKLHEVRANLRRYVRDQLDAQKNPPTEAQGLLSDLPVVGAIPIPGPLGDVVAFMQKVTGKLYAVQTALIFELLINMQSSIEKACLELSLDQIQKKTSPIYPAWFLPPPAAEPGQDEPFADYQQQDVIQGDLKEIEALDAINQGVQQGVADANEAVNEAVAPAMEVIDFLSKKVEPAPGSPYLAHVFGAQKDPDVPVYGSAVLGKVAVGAFGRAMGSGEVPGFMVGFVSDLLEEVFTVCAGFLRAVYDKLCGLRPNEVVASAELVKAGRENLVFQLCDLALEKCGLAALLQELTFTLPQPPMLPAGINWPDETLTADPIIALLEAKLSDELAPFLDPVMDYAMAGLAERLNAQRVWAGGKAMTMEAHLAQLPSELALMFRNLFGPLWEFLTDTLMGAVNDVVAEVLGPLASAVGVAKDGLGFVTGAIDDAKKKAAQAQAYAQNVEDKAGKLMEELSNVEVSTDDFGDVEDVVGAAEELAAAAGADPFAEDAASGGGGGPSGAPFPQNRRPVGRGVKIERAELDAVTPDLKWDEAGLDEEGDEAAASAEEATP